MRVDHGLFALVLVVLLNITAFTIAIPTVTAAPAPQGFPGTVTTIMINNDVEMGDAAIQNGWSGNGTLTNPWIIAGNATTDNLDMEGGAFGIYIANITSTHFIVQDWHIHNSSTGVALTIKNINTPFLVRNLIINDVMNGVIINKTTDSSAVREVNLNNVSMDGINLGNSSNFYIEDNSVNNATRAIVTSFCTRIYVRDNLLTDGQGSIYVHQSVAGVVLYGTTWTTVSGNNITEINMGIYPQYAHNNTIENNQIFECAEGIYLDQASRGNLIQYNNVFNMSETAIVLNYDATQNTVAHNIITNCSWEGIYSVRSVRASIHDNVIVDSGIGIHLAINSSSAQIANNRIEGNTVGVVVSHSNQSSITGNYVANSTYEGLVLQGTFGHTVQNNHLFNNGGLGIMAENCTGSSFSLNMMIDNNGAGATYDGAHVQAFDNRTTNEWSATGLGNYWQDWTAPDADGDSIVDVPYLVGGGPLSDASPLAYPVGMVNNLEGLTGYIWARIAWNAPNYSAASPLLKYVITRTNGSTSVVFERAAGITQLNDTTITPGISYNYAVVATNMFGQSGVMNASLLATPINLPYVSITAPADETIVSPDVVVKITFSEAMDQSSVEFTGISGTMTWNTAGTELTLTHAALTYATIYNIAISGTDLAGHELTGSTSWTFTVETRVNGTVKDDEGNPIANATVKLTQGTATVVEGVTDANGHFALIVDGVGEYNVTVSATGFQDLVQNDNAFGVGQNNTLGVLTMTLVADHTLMIAGVIVVLAIGLAMLFMFSRRRV